MKLEVNFTSFLLLVSHSDLCVQCYKSVNCSEEKFDENTREFFSTSGDTKMNGHNYRHKTLYKTIGYIKSLSSLHFSFYLYLQIFEYIIFKLFCS